MGEADLKLASRMTELESALRECVEELEFYADETGGPTLKAICKRAKELLPD